MDNSQAYNFISIGGTDLPLYHIEDLTTSVTNVFKWIDPESDELNSTFRNRLDTDRTYKPGGSRLVIMSSSSSLNMTLLNSTLLQLPQSGLFFGTKV